MKTYALLAALVVGLALTWITSPDPASAQTDPAPDINQSFVACYRSIVQADDLFCLTRFELPTHTTDTPVSPEAWCALLVDTDGCIDDPVDPTNPTSLTSGAAYITLYDGATLLGQAQAQRIGHTIGGLYFPAGHGITWANGDVTGCVESSDTLFTTSSEDCIPVFWNTEANTTAAQLAKLSADLVAQMSALETVDELVPAGGYVVSNKITPAGRDLALEALNVMDVILTGAFQSAAVPGITDSFATPSSELPLQTSINATATAVAGGFQGVGTSFGIPAGAVGLGIFTAVGIAVFAVVYRLTDGNGSMSVAAMLTTMLSGTLVGAIPIAVAAVTAVLLFGVGGLFVARKLGVT